jgi:hypothetical protein
MIVLRSMAACLWVLVLSHTGFASTDPSFFIDGLPLGLVEIAKLPDCTIVEVCEPAQLPLRTKPDLATKPSQVVNYRRELRFQSYSESQAGALVYKWQGGRQVDDWFMVRLNTQQGARFWIHKKEIHAYLPLERLLTKYHLMILDSWDGALRESPTAKSPVKLGHGGAQ